MASFSLMEWDSDFFGYKVARIDLFQDTSVQLMNIIDELKGRDIKLIYCFAKPEDQIANQAIKQCSGYLVDEKVTYKYLINRDKEYEQDANISIYDEKEVSADLIKLTLQSGIYSRFNTDANFENHEYENLYKEWIRKSVSKEIADQVLVYSERRFPLGVITISKKESHGNIGLLAVDEASRGKSIGRKLLSSALAYFDKNDINCVDVVTQRANKIACMFYESCGFEVRDVMNIYHLWIR